MPSPIIRKWRENGMRRFTQIDPNEPKWTQMAIQMNPNGDPNEPKWQFKWKIIAIKSLQLILLQILNELHYDFLKSYMGYLD